MRATFCRLSFFALQLRVRDTQMKEHLPNIRMSLLLHFTVKRRYVLRALILIAQFCMKTGKMTYYEEHNASVAPVSTD